MPALPAQLLEEYVVGWAAGTIRRYRKTPYPPGTLPGLSRWCRTLRHDIMKDVCRPGSGSDPLAEGTAVKSAGVLARGPTAKPAKRRKVKNSAFRKAEHYRLLCNGESWRAG